MPFVRRVIDSNMLAGVIDIPESLKNRQVEVLVFSIEDDKKIAVKSQGKKARGILSHYKNIELIEEESRVWAETVTHNYENR